MFSIPFAILAAASIVRGGAITNASRDFSIERDQDILRLLEPNYNPDDTTNLTSRSVLDALLNRRQSCSPGYGYCSGKTPQPPFRGGTARRPPGCKGNAM